MDVWMVGCLCVLRLKIKIISVGFILFSVNPFQNIYLKKFMLKLFNAKLPAVFEKMIFVKSLDSFRKDYGSQDLK